MMRIKAFPYNDEGGTGIWIRYRLVNRVPCASAVLRCRVLVLVLVCTVIRSCVIVGDSDEKVRLCGSEGECSGRE
jgi:hypothetical protein